MSILSCTGNFNFLLSKMANSKMKDYKPVNGKVRAMLQTDITSSIVHRIVSGGRPTSIVNDSGLQQVMRVEFQNMNASCPPDKI